MGHSNIVARMSERVRDPQNPEWECYPLPEQLRIRLIAASEGGTSPMPSASAGSRACGWRSITVGTRTHFPVPEHLFHTFNVNPVSRAVLTDERPGSWVDIAAPPAQCLGGRHPMMSSLDAIANIYIHWKPPRLKRPFRTSHRASQISHASYHVDQVIDSIPGAGIAKTAPAW